MGAIGYSSIMTSAYSYLLSLDPNASTRLYGWIIAFYSVGQFVSSPILGYMSQRLPCRPLFAITILLMAFGNLLYSYLSLFPAQNAGWSIFLILPFFYTEAKPCFANTSKEISELLKRYPDKQYHTENQGLRSRPIFLINSANLVCEKHVFILYLFQFSTFK